MGEFEVDVNSLLYYVLNTIADLCGNTLTELNICTKDLNSNMISRFKALKNLEIEDTFISDLGPHPELKSLRFTGCKFEHSILCTNLFPKLEEVFFIYNKELTDDNLIEFQK